MNYLKSSCNEKKYIKNQMPLLKFMVHEIKEIYGKSENRYITKHSHVVMLLVCVRLHL